MSTKPRKAYFAPDNLNDPALTRLIFRLGMPAVAGLSINAVHHTINMVFVGMIGSHEIAAITVVLPILMMIGAIGEGLGVGVATAIGRALGAGDPQRANVTASTLAALTIPLGLALTAGILMFRRELLVLFGASDAILPLAEHYLTIVAVSVTLTMLQILADFIAISEGNTRFSMWTLIGCFALNIALDPILIFWFGFGLAGAAVATILSQIAALAAYLLYFTKRVGTLHLAMRFATLRMDILKPVLLIGLPTTLTSMLSSISFAVLFTFAGFYRGDSGIAGVGIAMRVLILGMLPIVGLSLGGQAVLSFAWGAKNPTRLLTASATLLKLTSGFAVLYGFGAVLLRYPVAAIFTNDGEIAEIAALTIVVTHVPFVFFGARQILIVLLQAQGRARLAGIISVAQNGYFLLPLLLVLPHWFAFAGVIASLFLAPMLTAFMSLALLVVTMRQLRGHSSSVTITSFNSTVSERAS
ncbi:MATE family efflux transporter [Phyllobacterium brassicacearum]|uniref:MATE family efflux transporter n=1 Tax=Phyllobacterium brassicacearum TaxID=314235 RepID=A0A2P7BP15_9HYPH|nr:MATE family efflux transporter [Phyllobacterium brassicacearum]PSH68207.1 MATE family efflux transporter [Phyllobacterium brassicacearum]TDQ29554.1 putative MATE family efflux protein [Phyllobacterium brassicacearum]